METKTLSETQAVEIVLALLGLAPNLKLYDSADYQYLVGFREIKSTVSTGQMGIDIDFQIKSKSRWSKDFQDTDYRLHIGYYETVKQFNPAVIALERIVERDGKVEYETEVLGNVALVTDRLRELGIWDAVE